MPKTGVPIGYGSGIKATPTGKKGRWAPELRQLRVQHFPLLAGRDRPRCRSSARIARLPLIARPAPGGQGDVHGGAIDVANRCPSSHRKTVRRPTIRGGDDFGKFVPRKKTLPLHQLRGNGHPLARRGSRLGKLRPPTGWARRWSGREQS